MADTKPRILILGGSGFIGRHIVTYLFKNKLASKVCVSDKVLYQIAGLSAEERAIYENEDFLVFKQADLSNPDHVKRAFEAGGGNWQYVINCCAVTKYSQGKEVYDVNIVTAAKLTSAAAKENKARRYIHVSTAQIYQPSKKEPAKETSQLKAWTDIARAHLEAEQIIAGVSGLDYIIVRPGIVYGPGDVLGLTPRLMTGAVYKETKKTMKTLYTSGLQANTVHVRDVAAAIVYLTNHGNKGDMYNLVDKNETDQGKINALLEKVYGIETQFLNPVKMTAASAMGAKYLVGFINDMHLKPFSDAMKKYKIMDTPLTPYLDEELIKDTATYVDGSKIESIGFKYSHPNVTVDLLKEVLADYVAKGFFPKELVG